MELTIMNAIHALKTLLMVLDISFTIILAIKTVLLDSILTTLINFVKHVLLHVLLVHLAAIVLHVFKDSPINLTMVNAQNFNV
jgi:hypothetical protein